MTFCTAYKKAKRDLILRPDCGFESIQGSCFSDEFLAYAGYTVSPLLIFTTGSKMFSINILTLFLLLSFAFYSTIYDVFLIY